MEGVTALGGDIATPASSMIAVMSLPTTIPLLTLVA